MEGLLKNPFIMILLCIMIGQVVGKIGVGHFKLGSSGVLFAGLLVSFIVGQNGVVLAIPKVLLQVSLIGFIVTVGLKASKDIVSVVKEYGLKFVILGLAITATGAFSTSNMIQIFSHMKFKVVGTYVGSLTSSPGLATALELAGPDKGASIGIGYALAYIPGVIMVIMFSQITGKKYMLTASNVKTMKEVDGDQLKVSKLAIVVLVGCLIGSIKFMNISLGLTGGVLISSLVLGSSFKGFSFKKDNLNIIRDISLASFLAIVGLKYGNQAASTLKAAGIQLLLIGIVTGAASLIIGYILGKYILKIESAILVGGICGGMTSTPGLAAASEAFKSDRVTAGYGATYPFALIGMIIFTNILFNGG